MNEKKQGAIPLGWITPVNGCALCQNDIINWVTLIFFQASIFTTGRVLLAFSTSSAGNS